MCIHGGALLKVLVARCETKRLSFPYARPLPHTALLSHNVGNTSVVSRVNTAVGVPGNGVMISGYSRNTTVKNNEFHLVGENCIVSWGYTTDFPDAKRAVPIPATQGPGTKVHRYC